MSQQDDCSPLGRTSQVVNGSVHGVVLQADSLNGGVHVHSPAPYSAVTLPHRAGTVLLKAAAFQSRATTDQLSKMLDLGEAVVLTSDQVMHTSVVAGMGGVGKTQIAVDYAESLWESGQVDLLLWVTAGSREAIVSAYAELAADLAGFAEPEPEPEPERGARRLLDRLANMAASWLVVLDDVQNPADLRGLWPPRSRTGRTVVTTRRRDTSGLDR